MAYLKDYYVRKCTDNLWRCIPKSYVLPRTLVPERYWEDGRGFPTKRECIEDEKGFTYRGNK